MLPNLLEKFHQSPCGTQRTVLNAMAQLQETVEGEGGDFRLAEPLRPGFDGFFVLDPPPRLPPFRHALRAVWQV